MKRLTRHLRVLLYRASIFAARGLPRSSQRSFRLVILKLDRLGDATLSLGAMRRLMQHFGADDTLLIVSPIAEPLLRAEFPRTAMLVLPAFCGRFWPDFLTFLWRHAGELRAVTADTLVCLRHQPSDYLHAIARFINPLHCHASSWTGPRGSVGLTFPRATLVAYPEVRGSANLELEAHRRVVASATGQEVTMGEVLPTIVSMAPTNGDALLVCPAVGSAIREYPPRLLAESLRLFLPNQTLPVHVCLPSDMDPQPWQQALADAGVECQGWHHPATLQDLLQLLAKARLVLAPDSAPAHLATVLDKPGVFILGGGHFGMFAPWHKNPRQIWLNHPMACYQCRWNCIHPEAYCITHITPSTVSEALMQAFNAG